ncbi:Cytochrome C oxidase, cbb3-type, subunit III [Rhizobiales bacterium GAS191]|jgi:mono/diheme cytochrome c family protein|nr:Cytochrome C oxidase, cbb3-type, subunit III [Rhizobiales bacterium GAS113]SEC85160.1 Cytochrome C oxidase, cbb3-type, subunit III [Rhizobiales bacterium GAS191]
MSQSILSMKGAGMRALILGLMAGLTIGGGAGAARAQSTNFLSTMPRFPEQSGEELYKGICQGCHMPDAKGAKGAGAYPALAGDTKLEAGGYPVTVVVRGQKAMPSFGYSLSDDQVAAVVNYVRSHFGNAYKDEVTAADVKAARP